MRSILISIKPQWVRKILNREKTIEIRKTIPKCALPCKVYIYCTKGKDLWMHNKETIILGNTDLTSYWLNGKVVAEFTLNKIDKIEICDPYIFRNNEQEDWKYFEKNACLTCEQMMEYIGYGEDHDGWDKKYDIGYAWHIDNLIVYDTPKELSEFKKENKCHYANYEKGCCFEHCTFFDLKDCDGRYSKLYKAPQSWCYVEGE